MTDNQREAGTIILDPTHVSFSQQEGVNDLGATHFIGIGGAGMSVLAEMLHEQGVEVDGNRRSACGGRTHRAPQRHSFVADEYETCGNGCGSPWQNHDQFHARPYSHPCR